MLLLAVKRVPLLVWALLIALLPPLFHMVDQYWALAHGELVGAHDPDSWLRLTLVRNWLSGGSWYDHTYASNAPFGPITSPWTRPLDLVIAFFTKLQFTSASLDVKLIRSAILLPTLWMGLLAWALLYSAQKLTRVPHAVPMLAVLLVTAPINYNYFGPANADHHAPLSMLFCWAVALLLTGDLKRGPTPTIIGLLLALMIWISPEAMLPTALLYGWLGLRWLAGDSLRPLVRVSTATALGVTTAVMIEHRPADWLTTYYDLTSISQAMALSLVALATRPLARVTSFFWLWRALAAFVLLIAIVLFLHGVDGKFFQGPVAQGDDYIKKEFLPRIFEVRSALSQSPLKILGFLLQPLIAMWVAFRCAKQRKGIIAPAHAACLLYLLVTTMGLYFTQVRWAYYFFPLVPLVLAPYLAAWLNPDHKDAAPYWPASRLRRLSEQQRFARRAPLLLALLALPPIILICAALQEQKHETDISACVSDARTLIQNGEIAAIGGGKPQVIYSLTDLGAEILYFTPHRIIASNYHREGPGIKAVWDAQLADDLKPFHATLRARKATLAILCRDGGAPDDAALHRLIDGRLKPPAYLTPYKIKTPGMSAIPPAIFLVKPGGR